MVHYIAIALPKLCPVLLLGRSHRRLSIYRSPVIIMAQIILAILLASATAAIFGDRRARNLTSHGRFVPCLWAYRITASAPITSNCRRYRSPRFVMPPSFTLPPLEFCRGTRSIQAARSLPVLNAAGSGTAATIALVSTGPDARHFHQPATQFRGPGARPDPAIILQDLVIHQTELADQRR
jgi:hypothetical protein